jgi:O-antigen/teichoic acid export membrane protein
MLIGNSLGALARWAIVVIVAKLGTQEMVGQFGWGVAFCLPTITIFRFGLRILLTTDASSEIPFREYFSFAILGSVFGFLTIVSMGLLNQLDASTLALVAAIALWNSIESISDLFGGLFQRLERMEFVGTANLIQLAPMCMAMGMGVGLANSMLVGACGLVLAAVIRLVCYELPVARRLLQEFPQHAISTTGSTGRWAPLRPQFNRRTAWRLLQLGTPLAVVTFLMAFTASAPRYIIKDILNDARVGVFVALLSVSTAQNLVIGSVAQSIASRLATLFYQRQRAVLVGLILKAMVVSLCVGIPGLLLASVAGKQILTIVFTKDYAADSDVFLILMISGLIDGIGFVLGTATSSMRRFAIQAPIQAGKLAITFFGSVWAVQNYDLVGVAWVVVLAATFTVVCYASLCWWGLRSE